MNKAAIYCRVGRKEQCKSQALSAQRLSCEQYAVNNPTEYEKFKKGLNTAKEKTVFSPF